MNTKFINTKVAFLVMAIIAYTFTSCNKYLDGTQLPANTIDGGTVYLSDVTTSTVVTGVYLTMNNSGPINYSSGSSLGLYTDELKSFSTANDVFYKNAIQSAQSLNWSDVYKKLFVINSAIEGINNTPATLIYKNQWLGECYFLRGLFYFMLTNYYGDVPLALTSNYTVNNILSRAPQSQVYQQIIADLKLAQSLLSTDYKNGYGVTTTNPLRPNKAVATALLARVYIYTKDWANAEAQATAVITNPAYQILPLSQVFLANSKETIWALAPNSPRPTTEYSIYNNGMPAVIISPQTTASSSVYLAMSDLLVNTFEANDGRFNNWVRSSIVTASGSTPAITYYFPNKYKSSANNAEYPIILRLAEQYLIRAEARTMLAESNAADDINVIRSRAGLPNTTASGQAGLLNAIAKERQVELFTEFGHRFFDLKRTGNIDAVMNVVAPLKGGTWSSYMALFPIPPADLIQDPNLTPNPGYLQ